MSMRCRISKLDRGLKSKIVALLYANGCAKEDVDMLVQCGTLADVSEYVDVENLLDKLESKPYNSIVRFEDLRIEKLLDLLWD